MASLTNVASITPRKPGRPKVPRAVREGQILEVAERVFADHGFHSASVDRIAEGAGISKPMVYAYFGSKEGLYLACMARARRRLFATIDEAANVEAAPDEQLWRGVLGFLSFVERERDAWNILFGEAAGGAGAFAEEADRVRGQIARLVTQLLGEAAEAEGVGASGLAATEPLAHALVGAGESLADWWLSHQELQKEAVAVYLMNFAWLGFSDLVRGAAWTPPAERSTG